MQALDGALLLLTCCTFYVGLKGVPFATVICQGHAFLSFAFLALALKSAVTTPCRLNP
jgi:hypothetical protein